MNAKAGLMFVQAVGDLVAELAKLPNGQEAIAVFTDNVTKLVTRLVQVLAEERRERATEEKRLIHELLDRVVQLEEKASTP